MVDDFTSAGRRRARRTGTGTGTGAGRKGARAARRDERRAAILAAALDEFAARGFAATRLDDVARRAGVAKGTIYLHFRDKESLFQELVRSMLSPLVGTIEAAALRDLPIRAVVETIVDLFVNEIYGTRRKDVIRLIIAEGRAFPSSPSSTIAKSSRACCRSCAPGSPWRWNAANSPTTRSPAFRNCWSRPPLCPSYGTPCSGAWLRSTCASSCARISKCCSGRGAGHERPPLNARIARGPSPRRLRYSKRADLSGLGRGRADLRRSRRDRSRRDAHGARGRSGRARHAAVHHRSRSAAGRRRHAGGGGEERAAGLRPRATALEAAGRDAKNPRRRRGCAAHRAGEAQLGADEALTPQSLQPRHRLGPADLLPRGRAGPGRQTDPRAVAPRQPEGAVLRQRSDVAQAQIRRPRHRHV